MVTRLIYSNYFKSKKAVKAITFSKWNASSAPSFNKLKLLKVSEINVLQTRCFVFKSIHGLLPFQFKDIFVLNNEMFSYNTRNKDNIYITSHRINVRACSIKVYGSRIWNSLNQVFNTVFH